jgi:long-subunit fatty acid transport protein
MGRAFAGEAAIADNASVLSRNAAAMTRFDTMAFSGGFIYVHPDVNIEGTTRVPTPKGPVSLDAGAHDIAGDAWVPNAYLIVPLNEQWRLGLAATSYYGLGVKMPVTSATSPTSRPWIWWPPWPIASTASGPSGPVSPPFRGKGKWAALSPPTTR